MSLTTILAAAFAVVTSPVIAFQLGLAAGAPWGEYAMGGAFRGRMPAGMRVAAVIQSVLLTGLVVVTLSAAGVLWSGLAETFRWLAWVPVVFSLVSVALNASTRSSGERRLWLPVALGMLACSLGVALTA